MIRCAFSDSLSPLTSTPEAVSSSSSRSKTAGSTTTPSAITLVMWG